MTICIPQGDMGRQGGAGLPFGYGKKKKRDYRFQNSHEIKKAPGLMVGKGGVWGAVKVGFGFWQVGPWGEFRWRWQGYRWAGPYTP